MTKEIDVTFVNPEMSMIALETNGVEDSIDVIELQTCIDNMTKNDEAIILLHKAVVSLEQLEEAISVGVNRDMANIVLQTIIQPLEIEAISLEGIKDGARKIWLAIKALFIKIMQSINDFYEKIFKGTGHLITKADRLLNKAKNITFDGNTIHHAEMNVEWLCYNNKHDVNAVLKGLHETEKGITELFLDIAHSSQKLINVWSDYFYKLSKSEDFKIPEVKIRGIHGWSIKIPYRVGIKEIVLSGGCLITPTLNGFLYTTVRHKQTVKRTAVQLLKPEEIIKISDIVKDIAKILLKQKEIVKRSNDYIKKIIKDGDSLLKEVEAGRFNRWNTVTSLASSSKGILQNYNRTMSEVANYSYRIAIDAIRYGEQSLKVYL